MKMSNAQWEDVSSLGHEWEGEVGFPKSVSADALGRAVPQDGPSAGGTQQEKRSGDPTPGRAFRGGGRSRKNAQGIQHPTSLFYPLTF